MAEQVFVIDRSVRCQEIAADDEEWKSIAALGEIMQTPNANTEERVAVLHALFEILIHTPGMSKLHRSFEEARAQFQEDHPSGVVKVLVRM
jgi:hypothetical protein